MLKGSNFAPPWIETDKEVRDLLAQRDCRACARSLASADRARRDRAELTTIVKAVNEAIFRLNHEAPTERQHRRLLDLDRELAALARAHGA